MRDEASIRRLARRLGVRTDYAEKDYVNSWMLYRIYSTSFGENLLFKGGTALSKLYFPNTWRFSEDLDFTVTGNPSASRETLAETLEMISRRSGIEFWITEFYESPDTGYPVSYIEASIQYRAMFDHRNTTELNLMSDEVVASTPVTHEYDYEDVPPVSLTAYSLAEIFAEKLRTIYQRARGRDFYDLYQLVVGDWTPPAATVASIFAAKCEHAPADSFHTTPNPRQGLPLTNRGTIVDDWETRLPELAAELPPFETVEGRLNAYLVDTLGPELRAG